MEVELLLERVPVTSVREKPPDVIGEISKSNLTALTSKGMGVFLEGVCSSDRDTDLIGIYFLYAH